MCGRYLFLDGNHAEAEQLFQQLKIELDEKQLAALSLHEVFPSQKTIVCVEGMKPQIMEWGYEKWDKKGRIINARLETLGQSQFFKAAKSRRCIILASGYFEWNKAKEKIYFSRQSALYMAGVYNPQKQFAIITQPALAPYDAIHHRMPLVFEKENALNYLSHQALKKEAVMLEVKPQ